MNETQVRIARRVADRSGELSLRTLSAATLAADGETLAGLRYLPDVIAAESLHGVQGHLRLLRPVIETAWNERHREVLRRVNTALTDRQVLEVLLTLELDRDTRSILDRRLLGATWQLWESLGSAEWDAMTDALRSDSWPRRSGRFDPNGPATEFLPGQLLPLFRKLDRLRHAEESDMSLRLIAKTVARLATGLELLGRAGSPEARSGAEHCRVLLHRLAPAVLHSRSVELLDALGLAGELAAPLQPSSPEAPRHLDELLMREALARTPKEAEAVRAAGTVIWRRADGRIEVVLVSRSRQQDWSLPKGKCATTESFTQCAVRETLEETGLHCELGTELLEARYRDRAGRKKLVRYWSARPVGGSLTAANEIERAEWFELQAAIRVVTKRREAEVLASLTVCAESVA